MTESELELDAEMFAALQLSKHRIVHSKKKANHTANLSSDAKVERKLSIADIEVSTEMLESTSMDDIVKIAKRLPQRVGPDWKVIKPMDRVMHFLKQTKKLLKERDDKKKQEVLRDMVQEHPKPKEEPQRKQPLK